VLIDEAGRPQAGPLHSMVEAARAKPRMPAMGDIAVAFLRLSFFPSRVISILVLSSRTPPSLRGVGAGGSKVWSLRRIAAARTTQAHGNPPELWPIRLSRTGVRHGIPPKRSGVACLEAHGDCLWSSPVCWRSDRDRAKPSKNRCFGHSCPAHVSEMQGWSAPAIHNRNGPYFQIGGTFGCSARRLV